MTVGASPVKAVMYTQFEDVEGYVVAASDPHNVMVDQFKEIGYHFLPDRGVCWRLITLALGEYKIIGVPVHIDDSKYARRAFVFCFCLIVANNPSAVKMAKVAAQELAELFHSLEEESSLLSEEPNRVALPDFLRELRSNLNAPQSQSLNLGIRDKWLQFSKPHLQTALATQVINPWSVPISLVDHNHISDTTADRVILDVLEACDGLRTVSELTHALRIDFAELSELLGSLHSRSLVCVMDQAIDKYSRVRLTSKFHSFFDDLSNRQEAVSYALQAAQTGRNSQTSSTSSTPLTSPAEPIGNVGDLLVRMYCRLDGHVEDLGEFSAHHDGSNISVRHMIIFGLIKGFLRCKTMFPVFPEHTGTMIPVLRSCDGSRCWDEVGMKHGLTRSELNDLFVHHGVLRIWR